jgi:hypothetical protein
MTKMFLNLTGVWNFGHWNIGYCLGFGAWDLVLIIHKPSLLLPRGHSHPFLHLSHHSLF